MTRNDVPAQLLVIQIPDTVIFPSCTVPLVLSNFSDTVLDEFQTNMPYVLFVSDLGDGRLLNVGVVGKAQTYKPRMKSKKRAATIEFTMHFRATFSLLPVPGELGLAHWVEYPDILVSSSETQTQKFKQALNELGANFRALRDIALLTLNEEEKSNFEHRVSPEAIEEWFQKPDIEKLAEMLDRISGSLIFLISGESVALNIPLLVLLQEQSVLVRFELLHKLLDAFVNGTALGGDPMNEFETPQRRSQKSDATDLERQYREIKDKIPKEAQYEIERELTRLRMDLHSAEAAMVKEHLTWLFGMPWGVRTEDTRDLNAVKRILDKDHWGLEKVKERILEYLAVRQLNPETKAPILCFVGPPGVGKTSLGKSIARALGRKFVRLSLGGMRDEADIKGHSGTYVNALPGKIVQMIRRAGSANPVFMLDEIDKIGADWRGDPASAFLEVLDPEQNKSFFDRYLNVPFDLSKVFFITTGNIVETVHPALRDRMEIIELPGYGEDEKVHIAENHLIPRKLSETGLIAENLSSLGLPAYTIAFSREALKQIVNLYAPEPGVRLLEQKIGEVCRKLAHELLTKKGILVPVQKEIQEQVGMETLPAVIEILPEHLHRYLGPPKRYEVMNDVNELSPGVAPILMVTSDGAGKVGFVEVSSRKDDKLDFKFTGHLQEVIRESCNVALSRLLHNGGPLAKEDYRRFIHVHFPEGAIQKDGPSAGVMILAAIYSCFRGIPMKKGLTGTGEIQLVRNIILPVGGIRQKLLAAIRAGFTDIMIPEANCRDVEEISEEVRSQIAVHYIRTHEDILKLAFPEHYLSKGTKKIKKLKKLCNWLPGFQKSPATAGLFFFEESGDILRDENRLFPFVAIVRKGNKR